MPRRKSTLAHRAIRVAGSWRLRFHGAGQDFVGGAIDVPGSLTADDLQVDIASGPCGYVATWPDGAGAVSTSLIVAAPPR